MLIIDAHCHLSRQSCPASELIQNMNSANVDLAVVFGRENTFIAESSEEFSGRFIPFVYFDPRYEEEALKEVDHYIGELGWKGIKIGHQHANARYMDPMMEKAEKYGAIVVIHSDHSVRNHPYIIWWQ